MRPSVPLIAVALAAVPFLVPLAAHAGAACPGLVFVAHQGPSCPAGTAWEVILPDGARLLTHGPDPLHGHPDAASHSAPSLPEPLPLRAPACVADHATQRHGVLVYARPSSVGDGYAAMAPRIRAMFGTANAVLRQEAAGFGALASFRMRCDSPGVATVLNVPLPISGTGDSFGQITGALRNAGLNSPLAKYWVWYADAVDCGCGGQGNVYVDDSPGAGNAANTGPAYALTYSQAGAGYFGALTMMHENGHNLGLVQLSAPHTSTAFHCTDGQDIMCYDDDAPAPPFVPVVCPDHDHYDCGHDDYFNPAPAAGSYLAMHWNVGSGASAYIEISPPDLVPTAPAAIVAVPQRDPCKVMVAWGPPADTGAGPVVQYRVYRAGPTVSVANVISGDGPPLVESQMTDIGFVNAGLASFTFCDANIPAPGDYAYRVAAVNAHGEGALSATAVIARA